MNSEKPFTHINGHPVEDPTARQSIEQLEQVTTQNIGLINENISKINEEKIIKDSIARLKNVVSKNLFNKYTLSNGDITKASSDIRLCSIQELWLEPGTYTFSSNIPTGYRYAIHGQNISKPPLAEYPVYILDPGWKTAGTIWTFTLQQGCYFDLTLSKEDNSSITLDEVLKFDYQLEKGSTATDIVPYLNLEEAMQKEEVYSFDETIIGKWIDNTLYRKIIVCTSPSEINVLTDIYNTPEGVNIAKIEGYFVSSDNKKININTRFNDSDFNNVYEDKNTNTIKMEIGNVNYINVSVVLIVEYTKTTD